MRRVQDYASFTVDALMRGDIEDVLSILGDSLTVYVEGEILLFRSRDVLRMYVASLIARNTVEGVYGIDARVVAQSLPLNGRFRFVASWTYDFGPDRDARAALIAFYCSEREGNAMIDMFEILEPAFDRSLEWHQRHTGQTIETLPDTGWGDRFDRGGKMG